MVKAKTLLRKLQANPEWRPSCRSCGTQLAERGVGVPHLCPDCHSERRDPEKFTPTGKKHLAPLPPCPACKGPRQRDGTKGTPTYCRLCRTRWLGYDVDGATSEEVTKALYLYSKYGLTLRQYRIMLDNQKGRCIICGRPPKYRGLHVEHDHGKSKRVRGLACQFCNRHKIASNTAESAKAVAEYLASDFDGRKL